MQLYVTKPV